MQIAPVAPRAATVSFVSPSPLLGADSAAAASLRAAGPSAAGGDLDKYYATAQGKEGADLLHALHFIIRTGHVDRGYSQARDELFSEIDDVDGDDKVEDLFTGESRGPITDRKNAYEKGFNTEHTWPQSQGATGIAQSDLHHLRASDVKTNEVRGHMPYGDVVRTEWTTGSGAAQAKMGVDALGTEVFEPHAAVKGDIARGLLYFYTRYAMSQTQRFSLEAFEHEVPTLLKWSAADPVDDAERLRNDAVQRVQGNRNPFIDHPEWVDAIHFDKLDLRHP